MTSTIQKPIPRAPLRNRVRVQLDGDPARVWALVGDLSRFPEFSTGLARVDATVDRDGRCMEYVCTFKPMAPGDESIVTREIVHWWDPERGYASSGAGGDAFGLSNDMHLVTLQPSGAGTLVTWEEYYDAADLSMMKPHFDEALRDAAANLVARFGGRIVDGYVEP